MAMKFADLVKSARRRAGLSQAALGKQLGKTGQAVSFWERGVTTPPDVEVVIRKLKALPTAPAGARSPASPERATTPKAARAPKATPPARVAAGNGHVLPATRRRRRRSDPAAANGTALPAVLPPRPAGDETPTAAILRLAGELRDLEARKTAIVAELGAAVAAAGR